MERLVNQIKKEYGFSKLKKIKDGKIEFQFHQSDCCGASYYIPIFSEIFSSPYKKKPQERVSGISKLTKESRIDDCEMQAIVAYNHLVTDLKTKKRVEIVQLLNYQHVILLIGRKENADIEKPKTWNQETVICDPWAKNSYLVENYTK